MNYTARLSQAIDTLTEARPLPRAPSGGGASFPPDPAAKDNPMAEFDRQFAEVFQKETKS